MIKKIVTGMCCFALSGIFMCSYGQSPKQINQDKINSAGKIKSVRVERDNTHEVEGDITNKQDVKKINQVDSDTDKQKDKGVKNLELQKDVIKHSSKSSKISGEATPEHNKLNTQVQSDKLKQPGTLDPNKKE